jgi:hypothetical protein
VQVKYKGRLSKPIVRRRVGPLASDEQRAAAVNAQVDELLSKLPLLADAHGVRHGDWFALAVSLARAHVPGFKIVEPAGRPTEWSFFDKAEFRLYVDSIRGSGKTLDASIKYVAKSDKWSSKVAGMTLGALRKHYYSADPRFFAVLADAKAYESMVGDD